MPILALDEVQHRAYEEIIELFAAGAPPEKILKFRPSAKAQDRVRELLAKNGDGTLTPEEHSELNQYGHIEHMMRLVKARARSYHRP